MIPPSARVVELETLLRQLHDAKSGGLDQEMWERYGEQHASEAEKAERYAGQESRRRVLAEVPAQLIALVERTRAEAPAELDAWCDAHVAYLSAFLTKTDNDVGKHVAKEELAAWAEVRAGKLAFVDENCFYITLDRELYLELFGLAV